MKSVSSSGSHTMEVDHSNSKEREATSAVIRNDEQNNRPISDVTMNTASSSNSMQVDIELNHLKNKSSSSHRMEVDPADSIAERISNVLIEEQDQIPSRLVKEFDDLNEKLGQGGFGSVGKFKNKKDGTIYAIKKIAGTNERYEREVQVLSALQHENIVRYYSCWTEPIANRFDGFVLYIQMEFCENRTLRAAIDSGELFDDRNRMWRIYRQIVEGISYIHSKNLIHRDLKVFYYFIYYSKEDMFVNSFVMFITA